MLKRLFRAAWLLMACAALVIGAPSGVRAASPTFDVQVVWPKREVEPGAVTTVAFRITNAVHEIARFHLDVALPEGWQLVVPLKEVELAPDDQKTVLLHVRVPSRALPGSHELGLIISAMDGTGEIRREPVLIDVLSVYGIELALEGLPQYAQAGMTHSAVVLVANTGNQELTPTLDATLSEWATVEFEEPTPALGAWESRRVPITIIPSRDIRSGRHALVVRARANEHAEVVQTTAFVDVIGSTTQPSASRTLYPIRVGLVGATATAGSAVGLLASGRGNIGILPSDGLELDVRVGTGHPSAFLGRQDEYRIGYRADRISLRIGDHRYALTPLTETGRLGRGAAGTIRLGDLVVNGLYSRSRQAHFGDSQYGAEVGYEIGPTTLSAQFLAREGWHAGRTGTLRLSTPKVLGSSAVVEVGATDGHEGVAGVYRAHVARRDPRFSYEARVLRTAPTSVGSPPSTDLREIRSAVRPLDWLSVEGSYSRTLQGTSADVVQQQSVYRGSVDMRREWSGSSVNVRTDFSVRDHQTSMPGVLVERGSESLRLETGIRGRLGSASMTAERGHVYAVGEKTPFQNYRLDGRLNGRSVDVSGAIGYRGGAGAHSLSLRDEWLLRTGLSAQIGSDTRLNADALLLFDRGDRDIATGLASVGIFHQLPWGHEFSFESQFRSFGRARFMSSDAVVTASYTVPFNIPISAGKVGFSVSGRVYDGETGNPMPDFALRMGEHLAVTDVRGRFDFDGITKGEYLLAPAPESLGLDRTPADREPLVIRLTDGDVTGLDVAILRTGTIRGRVLRFDEPPRRLDGGEAQTPLPVGGIESLVVEAVSGGERISLLTDSDGEFELSGVRPGTWTLRLVPGRIPDSHHVAQESYLVEVDPGATASIQIDVLPKERQLRIIESGRLGLE